MASVLVKDMPEVDVKNEVWIRKMRTLFRQLDNVGNGHLMVDSLIELSTSLMTAYPKMSSHKGDCLVAAMVDLWYGYMCTCVTEADRTTHQCNEAEFINNMAKVINTTFKEKFVQLLVDPIFNASDNDNDGKITGLEYKTTMKNLRVAERESDLIFKAQDKSRAGKLTKDDFEMLLADFFYNCDLKTSVKMFGAWVNYKRPEDYGEVECGPVWEGKMRILFRRLDVTENNYLSCQDFIKIARNITQRAHLPKAKADSVMRSFLNIWIKYIAVDKEGRHFAEINEKEFIKNMRSLINSEFRHEIDSFGWTFFKAVETAGEGFITIQEYRNLQEAWNVTREEADAMFKVLDQDKDGRVSRDEYLNGWVEYFLGENAQSIYKTFFGAAIIAHVVR